MAILDPDFDMPLYGWGDHPTSRPKNTNICVNLLQPHKERGMDQYDYKTINIPKGSENKFHRVFQTFGYRPITMQEINFQRSMDGKIEGTTDMAHFYYPQEADEAFLGLALHHNDEPVDNYVRMTYGRNRFANDFQKWRQAEHIYNRMTYDNYLLYCKALKAKKKRHLPVLITILFLLLLIGGAACLGVGIWNHGYEVKLADVLSGGVFGMLYWFGMAAAALSIVLFILFGVPRHAIESAKYGRYGDAMLKIEELKADFRNSFRHSNDIPSFDMDKLSGIEADNKISPIPAGK